MGRMPQKVWPRAGRGLTHLLELARHFLEHRLHVRTTNGRPRGERDSTPISRSNRTS